MPEKENQTNRPKKKGVVQAFMGGLLSGMSSLLSIPTEVIGSTVGSLMSINQSGVKEWVAENVKNLKDLMTLEKTTSISPISLPMGTKSSTPSVAEIAGATAKGGLAQSGKELALQKGTETTQRIKAEFDNLVKRGFFRDNPDYYYTLMFPFLREIVSSKNRQVSSWHFFADWQINLIDELIDAYGTAQKISEEAQQYGINLSTRDILDGMHARAFDTLYTFQSQGIIDFLFPNLNLDAIKDPHKRALTENWIASVYRGYKILKQEPPPVIKVLYNSLTKGASATGMLEMGIYSTAQDIQQASGETIEMPTEEITTETEPDIYTIQTQFLRK